jgi:tetratricopeptide (TPR) repeat protein
VDISISAMSMAQVNLSVRETVRSETLPGRDRGSNPNLIDASEYRRHFPKNAIKEFDRGVAAAKGGKRDDAIQHYQRSISLAPDFYPARNNLGSVYLSKSEFALARAQFEEAIKLNQSDAEARLNLANVLLKTNHNEDALKSVGEGLRRTPNSAFGQFLLGSIFQQMRKTPEAESALRRSLELDPLLFDAHLALANLYIQQRRTREAVSELRIFLKNFPENAFAPQAKQVLHQLENSNRNQGH